MRYTVAYELITAYKKIPLHGIDCSSHFANELSYWAARCCVWPRTVCPAVPSPMLWRANNVARIFSKERFAPTIFKMIK